MNPNTTQDATKFAEFTSALVSIAKERKAQLVPERNIRLAELEKRFSTLRNVLEEAIREGTYLCTSHITIEIDTMTVSLDSKIVSFDGKITFNDHQKDEKSVCFRYSTFKVRIELPEAFIICNAKGVREQSTEVAISSSRDCSDAWRNLYIQMVKSWNIGAFAISEITNIEKPVFEIDV